jgi:hypothetical protein
MQPEEENLRLRAVTDLPLDEENASVCHPPKNLRLALSSTLANQAARQSA